MTALLWLGAMCSALLTLGAVQPAAGQETQPANMPADLEAQIALLGSTLETALNQKAQWLTDLERAEYVQRVCEWLREERKTPIPQDAFIVLLRDIGQRPFWTAGPHQTKQDETGGREWLLDHVAILKRALTLFLRHGPLGREDLADWPARADSLVVLVRERLSNVAAVSPDDQMIEAQLAILREWLITTTSNSLWARLELPLDKGWEVNNWQALSQAIPQVAPGEPAKWYKSVVGPKLGTALARGIRTLVRRSIPDRFREDEELEDIWVEATLADLNVVRDGADPGRAAREHMVLYIFLMEVMHWREQTHTRWPYVLP